MKKISSILIICALLISGFSLSNNRVTAKDFPKYSGEDLYKGIVFGQGDVAMQLPQIWDKETLKQYNNRQNSIFVNRLVKQIKKKDPLYFTELKQAVYSGNQVKIDRYLNIGVGFLESYSVSQKINTPESLYSSNPGDASGKCLVIGLYVAIAYVKYLYVPKKKSTYFDKEKLVNEIANTFAK